MHLQSQNPLCLKSLIILNRLGRGATSHVFKAQSLSTGFLYAVKIIDKSSAYDEQSLLQQISLHSLLLHPNIVRLITRFQDANNHYIVTEYCNQGQISSLLLKHLNQCELASITRQVASALAYLHDQHIAHCDIKLNNILCHNGQLKLCDFGFSCREGTRESGRARGTLLFTPPELLLLHTTCVRRTADVWSLAICLLCLINKGKVYHKQADHQLQSQIIHSKPIIPQHVSILLQGLLRKMLEYQPEKRIIAREILKQQWVVQFQENKIIMEETIQLVRHKSEPVNYQSSITSQILQNLSHYQEAFNSKDTIIPSENSKKDNNMKINYIYGNLISPFKTQQYVFNKNKLTIEPDGTIRCQSIQNKLQISCFPYSILINNNICDLKQIQSNSILKQWYSEIFFFIQELKKKKFIHYQIKEQTNFYALSLQKDYFIAQINKQFILFHKIKTQRIKVHKKNTFFYVFLSELINYDQTQNLILDKEILQQFLSEQMSILNELLHEK